MVETQGSSSADQLAPASSRRVRKPPRRIERYWLCDQCAAAWTLMQDGSGSIALSPLQRAVSPTAATVGYWEGV
jgi:hypothetical protein